MYKKAILRLQKTQCTHLGARNKAHNENEKKKSSLQREAFRAKIDAREKLEKELKVAKLKEEAEQKKALNREAEEQAKLLCVVKNDRKEYGKIYREANKEGLRARNKLRYEKNKDSWKERQKIYRKENKAVIKEREKLYRENSKERRGRYYETNKEKIKEYYKLYGKINRAKSLARNAKRNADKIKATPRWADLKKIEAIYKCRQELSELTGIEYHVDHIIPLRGKLVCGLHVEYNLQVMPAIENRRKSNKLVDISLNYGNINM